MPKLIATKSFLYNTRRLLAGDEFEPVKPVHGRLLIAARKAREVRTPGKVAPPPAALAKKVAPVADDEIAVARAEAPLDPDGNLGSDTAPDGAGSVDELAAARAEYQEALGKRPFHGWGVEILREKLAETADS